jgi:hypothetical protein
MNRLLISIAVLFFCFCGGMDRQWHFLRVENPALFQQDVDRLKAELDAFRSVNNAGDYNPAWASTTFYDSGNAANLHYDLRFLRGKSFSAFDGCNTSTGECRRTGDSLKFGACTETRKGCPDLESVYQEQLKRYLFSSCRFSMNKDTLKLFNTCNNPLYFVSQE